MEWGVPALHAFSECASTNDVARTLALDDAPHGTTVIADHQHAGRGRHGRAWADHPGMSVLLSMVLRAERERAGAAHPTATVSLPLRVGLAAARALRDAIGLDVGIEWPNDLVVADRKLGGILCESSLTSAGLEFVVAGIGINVASRPADLDPTTRARATSLAELVGVPPARAAIAGRLARRLRTLRPDTALPDDELDELRRIDSLAGRAVRLGTGTEGIARGILPDGALAVEVDGTIIDVRSGSVSPAGPRTR